MATFYDYLETIQTAVYGKDVRAAMAQALEAVYEHSGTQQFDLKMDKANPTGTGAISITRKANTTTGQYSVSLGSNNEASGNYSVSLGYHCQATGGSSLAIGNECQSLGTATVALGLQNIAENTSGNTPGQTAVGRYNAADSDAMFIVGNGYNSNGEVYRRNAFVVKNNGAIYAKNDFVLQDTNCKISMMREPDTTAGMYSVTLGQSNTASDTRAMAIGYQNAATAEDSFAGGYGCQSNHIQSFAFGDSLRTGRNRQFVIGQYNDTVSDALFVVGNGFEDSTRSNAFIVKSTGETVCNGILYSTYKVNAPLVECTTCIASSVTASELNATDDVNIVDTNGNVDFSVRDFRESVDKYTLSMNLSIGDRDVSDPFTNADLELCEYLAGLTGGHHYTPSELYSLYQNLAIIRMNITRGNGRMLSFTLNDAGPLGTNGQLSFMFSKIDLSGVSTITLVSNSEQTHYTQETYTNN